MLGLVAAVGTVAASVAVFVQWHADVATVPTALARELRDATGEAHAQTERQQ